MSHIEHQRRQPPAQEAASSDKVFDMRQAAVGQGNYTATVLKKNNLGIAMHDACELLLLLIRIWLILTMRSNITRMKLISILEIHEPVRYT